HTRILDSPYVTILSTRPKGQVRDGKAVQYSIKDVKGRTKYIGTTNNPTRRAGEHRESGKLKNTDKLVVETRPIHRGKAERVEAAKLQSHRKAHGHNPKHNVTSDGQFHQPPLF
ncbi:MAG: GIY-YIG nuclease family protein, partial [Chloroflexota bacterium]|nr:GIY-YIG nuclease family protein [Chloroflexota bacterium]